MSLGRPIDDQQVEGWVADLLSDADFAERQADEGPYYPERGITVASLRAYAAECREQAAANPRASLRKALEGGNIPPEYLKPLSE